MKTLRDIIFGMSIMGLIINLIDFFIHNRHDDLTILAITFFIIYFSIEISERIDMYITNKTI